MIHLTDSEGLDYTAGMPKLIWTLDVRLCPKTCFRLVLL